MSTAGVSARTFFRYFATKEHAAFADARDALRIRYIALEAIAAGANPLVALDRAWATLLCEFDAEPDAHLRVTRVHALARREPTILALALRQDAENAAKLAMSLIGASASLDPLTAQVLVSTIAGIGRISFEQWIRSTEDGEDASVYAIYLRAREGVVPYLAHWAEAGSIPRQ